MPSYKHLVFDSRAIVHFLLNPLSLGFIAETTVSRIRQQTLLAATELSMVHGGPLRRYGLITALCARVFLHDILSERQYLGIGLACVAVLLLGS